MNALNDVQFNALMSRLDALGSQVATLVERQRAQQELIDELLLPVAKEMMKSATGTFAELEQQGVFAFGKELVAVGKKVVSHYSPDDVRALGDSIVTILDTVRALTQPEVLQVMAEAGDVLQHPEAAKPMGLVGMVRATRNEEVGRGISLMLEVMKRVGRGAAVMAQKQAGADPHAKLAALLGPRRRALPSPKPVVATAVAPVKVSPPPAVMPPAPACQVPAKAPVAAQTIEGVAFAADGSLVDQSQWNRALAERLAAQQGVAMDEPRWAIVDFARKDFAEMKASPNIRRITQGTGLVTRDLYTLFPKAPARTIARIAGLPKPAGCL